MKRKHTSTAKTAMATICASRISTSGPAAFIGFSMGSTATAMANMQAITAKYVPAPQSYLIVPLAGAFFIDLMNAFLLTLILALPFMGG